MFLSPNTLYAIVQLLVCYVLYKVKVCVCGCPTHSVYSRFCRDDPMMCLERYIFMHMCSCVCVHTHTHTHTHTHVHVYVHIFTQSIVFLETSDTPPDSAGHDGGGRSGGEEPAHRPVPCGHCAADREESGRRACH